MEAELPRRTGAMGDRIVGRRGTMDLTWITDRLAVGGGIWNDAKMILVVREGVTHIIDMQIEFDDRPLAEPYGIKVLWNPVDDDFEPKPPHIFAQGVDFYTQAVLDPAAKIFVHCAAGVHRAPMMALAILGRMGWPLDQAMHHMERKRPVVDFAPVYVNSVQKYLQNSG